MELGLAEVEGIVKACMKLVGRVLSSYGNTMHVRVCKILDVDATIATNALALTRPSFSGDVVDYSAKDVPRR